MSKGEGFGCAPIKREGAYIEYETGKEVERPEYWGMSFFEKLICKIKKRFWR